MALFFSRRSYNRQTHKFTKNPSSVTRYVSVKKQDPDGSVHTGGIYERDDWLELVEKAGGDKEVLIYVHGFNTDQTDMLKRLAKIEKGVRAQGFEGAVIAFDWPSDGSVLAYDRDRADAKRVAPCLVSDGILPLMALPSKPKIHVLAHSMGALVVLRGFSDIGDSLIGNWNVDQMMFCSADVDSQWLERGAWGCLVLKRRAERFTNYYSGRDLVLSFAGGFVHGGRERAGHVGMPDLIGQNQWDVYCNEQYKRDVPKSKQSDRVYSHRWWFDNNGFYEDMALTMKGESVPTMHTRRPTDQADLALLTPPPTEDD